MFLSASNLCYKMVCFLGLTLKCFLFLLKKKNAFFNLDVYNILFLCKLLSHLAAPELFQIRSAMPKVIIYPSVLRHLNQFLIKYSLQ